MAPVRVADTWHFAYEDGTRYYSIGTTCYVWDLQSDEKIAQTLETLKAKCIPAKSLLYFSQAL